MRWFWIGLVGCSGTNTSTSHHSETPGPTEQEVRDAIEAANHCDVPEDCVDVGGQCPFGCWILVHTDEAAAIEATIDDWLEGATQTCTYSCANRGEIRCEGNVCVADPTY